MKTLHNLLMAIAVVALVVTSFKNNRRIAALERQYSESEAALAKARAEREWDEGAAARDLNVRFSNIESFCVWLQKKMSKNFEIVGAAAHARASAEAKTLLDEDLWIPEDATHVLSVKTGNRVSVSQPLTELSVYRAALEWKRPVRFRTPGTGVTEDSLAVTDLVKAEHCLKWEWPQGAKGL